MRMWSALALLAACGNHPATLSDGSTFGQPDAGSSAADGPPGSAGDAPGGGPDAMPDGMVAVDAAIDSPGNSGPPPATQIFNVWPKIANPGTTLMLEGTFAGDALVHFPGGTTAMMSALSAHRATVVVPAGTTIGSLALDGTPNSHVIFHSHDYDLGFQKIEPYEQTDTARQPGLLAEGVYGHGSVTIGKYVYVIGGYTGTFSTRVQRATLNADGTLGNFAIVPGVSLVHGRDFFATA